MVKKGEIISPSHPIIKKKIDESLDLSVKEGAIASVSTGFGQSYISPFAIFLNATTSQMGILNAIINLIPSVIQVRAAKLLEKNSRKKIILIGSIFRAILWLLVIVTGVLFYFNVPHVAWILIGLAGLNYALYALIYPAWFSWVGSLVPDKGRGKYFSKRNIVAGFFGVLTMIVAAVILDSMKQIGIYTGHELEFSLLGFFILFTMAMVSRFWTYGINKKIYEPRLKIRKRDEFVLKDFLKHLINAPFGKFTLYRFLFSLAVGIATPFWVVYMIRNLGMSYTWYMMITVAAILFRLLFLPMIGKFSDNFGNIKLMKVCSWLAATIPLLWVASSFIANPFALKLYLLFIPSIAAGFAWAGYDLAVNNYVYDSLNSEKRSFGVAYMNLMYGLGAFVGALIGSGLVLINIAFMNRILFVFLISGGLRVLFATFGSKLLYEVRHVKKFRYEFLIREFQPMRGVVREIHNLEHIVKKNVHYA